jgi:hypothetical protein
LKIWREGGWLAADWEVALSKISENTRPGQSLPKFNPRASLQFLHHNHASPPLDYRFGVLLPLVGQFIWCFTALGQYWCAQAATVLIVFLTLKYA